MSLLISSQASLRVTDWVFIKGVFTVLCIGTFLFSQWIMSLQLLIVTVSVSPGLSQPEPKVLWFLIYRTVLLQIILEQSCLCPRTHHQVHHSLSDRRWLETLLKIQAAIGQQDFILWRSLKVSLKPIYSLNSCLFYFITST